MPERRLTPRQSAFVREYLVDLNATQAAVRASYSPKTAMAQGSRLLSNVEVAAAIQQAVAARAERVHFTADEVLRELAAIVNSDPRHYGMDNETGELVLTPGAPDLAWHAVSSVKRKVRIIHREHAEPIVEREMEFRLWNKNNAIEQAREHLGIRDVAPTKVIKEVTFRIVREGRRFPSAISGSEVLEREAE